MVQLTLYQFELCPYCHKVKAGLELKQVAYTKVEVNPMSKKEIQKFPVPEAGRRKVPILEFGDDYQRESGDILRRLDSLTPGTRSLWPDVVSDQDRINEINTWVDEHLTQILPTVLYGTWSEAIHAAKLTAQTSNFSRFDNMKVSLFGSVIMRMIAKRILKRRGEGKTPHELFQEQLDILETYIGDGPYIGGAQPNMADAAAHGPLMCVRAFPAFAHVEERPRVIEWFDRITALRQVEAASTAA
ncbi:MAG: glutathione S-transferase N-terminal domain-containing protein [Myxococcota bacterium]|nr:glutathione S-transferase N-terminal domain-containing protein [Myxococcota bacterium]